MEAATGRTCVLPGFGQGQIESGIAKDNGVKTDDLIMKVAIEYLKLLEGEYLNADNKDWKIKFEVVEGILFGNDRGY